MLAPRKGILAATRAATLAKRFGGAARRFSTDETRRNSRELLFPRRGRHQEQHIPRVILYDETVAQTASDGASLVKWVKERAAGLRVGLEALAMRRVSVRMLATNTQRRRWRSWLRSPWRGGGSVQAKRRPNIPSKLKGVEKIASPHSSFATATLSRECLDA